MPNCVHCRHSMQLISGLGEPAQYRCFNPSCPSNKQRRLACPTPRCNGRELEENLLGLGHLEYGCITCGFGFDELSAWQTTIRSARPLRRVEPAGRRRTGRSCSSRLTSRRA